MLQLRGAACWGRLKGPVATRPTIFKWRQTEPELILCAVRWYLRYSLSLRDVEELLEERGLEADHTTVWRWVQRYGPELEQRMRRHLKPTNKSWRMDEIYLKVKGRWCYVYRAIDSAGATIDFLLSGLPRENAEAAKRLFRKALSYRSHPQPRVINTDLAPIYTSAIPAIKKEGALRRRCRPHGKRGPRAGAEEVSLAAAQTRTEPENRTALPAARSAPLQPEDRPCLPS